ncbi:ABC transporter substrate-binding protein [soil metagenome]|nr:ABC transporter substrate-binding protein [Trueperaceae bacterium]
MKRLAFLALMAFGVVLAQSGTLELAVDGSPAGLDPHKVTAFSSFTIINLIYDGLLEINADLQLEGALAESYEISDDGLTYTFTLREGLEFHNGRAVTSDDVVYSLERILDPETGSPQASRFTQVAQTEAPDDRTVVFTLSEPFAPFLANMPNLYVVPREVVEEHGDLQQVAVGTGPFMLGEIVPDTFVRLDANPAYYRSGEPGVAELRFNIVPEASTRAAGLRTGTYHLLPDVDPTSAETLRRAPNVTVLGTQDLAYTLLGFNTTRAPFDDPRVRAAIGAAIDRDEVVQAVHLGNAVPAGPLSPALTDWALDTDAYPCYAQDTDAARSALADAGYPDGFAFTILTFGTNRVVADTAQVLQAQLERAGLDVEVNVAEFGTFVQDWQNSNFDAFVSLNGGNIDPDGYLHRTFITDGSTNVFQHSDPELDALLVRGRTTADVDARQEAYREAQMLLACEGPIAHIAYGTLFSAHTAAVEGFVQMPTRNLRYLRNVTLNR